MANNDSSSSADALVSENAMPVNSRLTELNESRDELLTRIQGLKHDLQNWRSKLDSQVKTHREELSELKKSLNHEVEELRLEFQGLKTTLEQQHEDVANSLKSLGLEDSAYVASSPEDPKLEEEKEGANEDDEVSKETEN
ncbi:uncharacterized protein LOC124921993 isoform X2 [Impatiens glandulifera]|uniref:uncharacterized protein LOC124921993 isoform X2 n=1 Tax=Impatiens glandulifera TaxID=253017 RepID=UPI001FB13DDD|nr:uncharacterized protein LOC124921993 isoform X2 [Impatiens glandulifera]